MNYYSTIPCASSQSEINRDTPVTSSRNIAPVPNIINNSSKGWIKPLRNTNIHLESVYANKSGSTIARPAKQINSNVEEIKLVNICRRDDRQPSTSIFTSPSKKSTNPEQDNYKRGEARKKDKAATLEPSSKCEKVFPEIASYQAASDLQKVAGKQERGKHMRDNSTFEKKVCYTSLSCPNFKLTTNVKTCAVNFGEPAGKQIIHEGKRIGPSADPRGQACICLLNDDHARYLIDSGSLLSQYCVVCDNSSRFDPPLQQQKMKDNKHNSLKLCEIQPYNVENQQNLNRCKTSNKHSTAPQQHPPDVGTSESSPLHPPFHPHTISKSGLSSRHRKVADSQKQVLFYQESNYSGTINLTLIFSPFIGLLFGFALLAVLTLHLQYGLLLSTFVSAIATVLLTLSCSLSVYFRCCLAIVLPSIFTNSSGRVGLLLIISGLLVAGPIDNFLTNVREMSRSLSCSAEQSYNQSLLLLDPYDRLALQLDSTLTGLKEAVRKAREDIRPLQDGLQQIDAAIYNGMLQLFGAHKVSTNI